MSLGVKSGRVPRAIARSRVRTAAPGARETMTAKRFPRWKVAVRVCAHYLRSPSNRATRPPVKLMGRASFSRRNLGVAVEKADENRALPIGSV